MEISNKIGGIYKIVCIINNKFYIGSTYRFKHRWQAEHLRLLKINTHPNEYLQKAFNKYGESSFVFEIVECINKRELLIEREQYYLDTLLFAQEYINNNDRRFIELGYNIKPIANNNTGMKWSEDAKNRVRGKNSKLYGKPKSEETKQKLREATSKDKHYNYGNKLTEEHKYKVSKSLMGNKNPNYGKPKSEETKQKLREANLGKKQSVETISKRIKNTKYKTTNVIQLNLEYNYLNEFSSLTIASKKLNINRSAISNCCLGVTKSAGGFRWIYKTEYEKNINDSKIYKIHVNKFSPKWSGIIQMDLNNNFIREWRSVKEVQDVLNINIYGVLQGKRKTAGKFKWKNKNE